MIKYPNKRFDELKRESEIEFRDKINIDIPDEYKVFKSKYGDFKISGQPPYLLLYQLEPKKSIGEFNSFSSYTSILHRLEQRTKYSEYKFEIDKELMLIGTCEEQVDIYMGYGKTNYQIVYIYDWEMANLIEVGSLTTLINSYIVEYDSELFE